MRIPAASACSAARPDHGPVGERIGEREAELDDVGAAGDGRLGERGRVGARPSGRSTSAFSVPLEAEHLGKILVAPARQADDDELRVELVDAGERRATDSSAGMIPSVRESRWKAVERLVVGARAGTRRGRGRAGTRARARRPGSRGRPRWSGRPRSGRPRRRGWTSASRAARPCGRLPRLAAPAASTPTSRTPGSSTKPANMPIAFEPPPTHATTASGSRPSASSSCSRASRPITACSSRTISG